jgi:RecA-family ATPase
VLKRVGLAPKRLLPFRCIIPFKKTCTPWFVTGDGVKHRVEVLADGQQFVAEGIHEDTGQPYTWGDGEHALNVPRADLAIMDEGLASRVVAVAGEIMKQAGWTEFNAGTGEDKKPRSNGNGKAATAEDFDPQYYRTALKNECERVSAMTKGGRNEALNKAAFSLFQLVAMGALDENEVRGRLYAAAEACGLVADDGAESVLATIKSGAKGGRENPRQAPDYGDEHADEHEGEPRRKDPAPLPWINMSNWDREPVPERKWAIRDRVPLNQAGLFSGEGGAGKSLIELAKDVAHVAGKEWLGSTPEQGPAIYIGAEDDEDELHIRLAAIADHYGVSFDELIAGGLHVLCLLGEDATLCAGTGKGGKVEVTDLYRRLYQAAGDIKPKNISIDTLTRAFAGSEIDRVQVYAFAMHMQKLAMVAGGAVTVLSHPSFQGMASGSGISGSTAWHGAFRFRQYLKGVKSEGDEQPDRDVRELEFKKNQYGPMSETIVLRYQHGLFLPVHGVTSLDQVEQEAKVEDLFLALLKRFALMNRFVSDKPSVTYAPAVFAKEEEAKHEMVTSKQFEAAMRRLFRAGVIWNEPCGKPSRPSFRIAIKAP